jgi:CheY-like chemotaxis protein
MGVTVEVANNGKEALERVAEGTFDLILMDMQMPVMDGIEACRTLREQGNQIPVIALTANVMQKHRDRFEEAGCNGFVSKPIDRQLLHHSIASFLSPAS